MSRWVAMHCTEEVETLQELYPNAFLLLCQIARRARWRDCPITGLRVGDAFIGDWQKAGLPSKKSYQVAKQRLEKCGLAQFQGGNKGTRARLLNSRIFSLTQDQRGNPEDTLTGSKGATKGNQGGTTHTEHREKTEAQSEQNQLVTYSASAENGQSPFPSDAVLLARISETDAPEIALEIKEADGADSDLAFVAPKRVRQWGIDWWIKAEQSGWIMDGKPIQNARLALRGYLRKAAAKNADRFQELREANQRPEAYSSEDDDIPF